MEKETTLQKPLQQLLQHSDLNLLEAALPFVPLEMKKLLAMYIKFSEMTEVMHGFEDEETLAMCGLDDQNMNYEMMLQAMRMAANKEQADKLEQMIRLMNLGKSLPAMMESAMSPQSSSNSQIDMMKTLANFMQMNQQTQAQSSSQTNAQKTPLERLMNDPRTASVPIEKLQFIQAFIKSNGESSPSELLPKMLQLNSQMQAQNLSFNKQEMELLLDILKESMTPEEKQQIDMLLKMLG